MTPKSAIEKGKLLENHIADRIVALGLDPKACRSTGSGNGNREKSDINTSLTVLGRNVGFEAKNHSNLAIPEWWRQAQKLEVLGREPIVAFKMRGDSLEDAKVVIKLETFLELIKLANTVSGIELQSTKKPEEERAIKWAIQGAKVALAKLDKML